MAEKPDNSAARLVEEYGSALFALCLVMLKNVPDAEDALQHALLRYMERAPAFDTREAERAWLFKVAANRCRDRLREARRRPTVTLEELAGLGAESGDRQLLAALMSLPEKPRGAMLLHYVEGYDVRETAKLLSLTPSCVKMRLKKGREPLRREISDG